jgi:hypothetical protein
MQISPLSTYTKCSEGVVDGRIATFAYQNGAVVLTHDPAFLSPKMRSGVSVLYYAGNTMDASEIVDRVVVLIRWVPNPEDVPPLSNLNN